MVMAIGNKFVQVVNSKVGNDKPGKPLGTSPNTITPSSVSPKNLTKTIPRITATKDPGIAGCIFFANLMIKIPAKPIHIVSK